MSNQSNSILALFSPSKMPCFSISSVSLIWKGDGLNEVGIDKKTGRAIIRIDEKYFRPTEVDTLLGDAAKAKKNLGWVSETKFSALVKIMIESDWKKVSSIPQPEKGISGQRPD